MKMSKNKYEKLLSEVMMISGNGFAPIGSQAIKEMSYDFENNPSQDFYSKKVELLTEALMILQSVQDMEPEPDFDLDVIVDSLISYIDAVTAMVAMGGDE